jgi:C4-dicarboxylate-binding protein DctP
VQPFFTVTNHGYVGYLVAVNPGFWNDLPDDVRTGLEEIMADVTTWENGQSVAINDDGRAKIEQSGRVTILELSDDELAAWRVAVQPVWTEFSGAIGTELIDAARSAAAGSHVN